MDLHDLAVFLSGILDNVLNIVQHGPETRGLYENLSCRHEVERYALLLWMLPTGIPV